MIGSWILTAAILIGLLGGCSVLAGNADHWPASVLAVLVLVPLKALNDRLKLFAWPMEFILVSGVTMILFNLVQLYFTPLPY